jgi:hypothetical protein
MEGWKFQFLEVTLLIQVYELSEGSPKCKVKVNSGRTIASLVVMQRSLTAYLTDSWLKRSQVGE